MKNKKNEKGSITIFVLTGMMFMLIVLMTAYAGINNKLQAQNKKIETIKLQYEGKNIEQEYKEAKERVKTLISKDTSYVGCYADMDADGTVDGIIYADLAIGGSGKWGDGSSRYTGEYTIPKETEGLKEYYISQTNCKYYEKRSAKDVISPTGAGGDKDRFYVMALEDFNKETKYCWYKNANSMSDYETTTSEDFGKGKTNTITMIKKWENKEYGAQDDADIWGQIQKEVDKGWYVPSIGEWLAFAGELGVSNNKWIEEYYSKLELVGENYWSSSQGYTKYAFFTGFASMRKNYLIGSNQLNVRLGTTF